MERAATDPDLRRLLVEPTKRSRWAVFILDPDANMIWPGREYDPAVTRPLSVKWDPEPWTMAKRLTRALNHEAELAERLAALEVPT
jgi:hypothetical protein